MPELLKAIEEIYKYPLLQSATDTLNRQLKSGIGDQALAELVISLRAGCPPVPCDRGRGIDRTAGHLLAGTAQAGLKDDRFMKIDVDSRAQVPQVVRLQHAFPRATGLGQPPGPARRARRRRHRSPHRRGARSAASSPMSARRSPTGAARLKIDHQVTKTAREHFVIYTDQSAGQPSLAMGPPRAGKPLASRDHRFDTSPVGRSAHPAAGSDRRSLEEEEDITVVDVVGGPRAAFDVEKVTKKFYDRFKAEHAAFLKFIKGIKAQADCEWYTSLMLNRLMFVYFIQKKGFLDGDTDYLRNRLAMVRQLRGKDKFQTFYRYFLLRLFHDGLGKTADERKLDQAWRSCSAKCPYLNGGFFEVHQLEEHNPDIDIPDKAFEKLFDFFDQYRGTWTSAPSAPTTKSTPMCVGYIFEKYINQKQMGAYYTKEDITEYISKNTIIPFLFDAAEKKCPIAFKPESFLWRLLRDDPDRYIYPASGTALPASMTGFTTAITNVWSNRFLFPVE